LVGFGRCLQNRALQLGDALQRDAIDYRRARSREK
jgi:hypothetical protein